MVQRPSERVGRIHFAADPAYDNRRLERHPKSRRYRKTGKPPGAGRSGLGQNARHRTPYRLSTEGRTCQPRLRHHPDFQPPCRAGNQTASVRTGRQPCRRRYRPDLRRDGDEAFGRAV